MRLLVISPAPVRGGAEEYALTIAAAAKSRGWEVHAGLPEAEGTLSLAEDLRVRGIRAHSLPCIDPWFGGSPATGQVVRSAMWHTLRILWRVRPDVVHLTLPWPSFGMASVLASAVIGLPTVVVFALVPEAPQSHGPKAKALYALARARRQRWVAVSNHGRQLIARTFGLPAQSIEVIHNGVTLPLDRATEPEARNTARASVRAELDLPSDSRIVLSIGRLHAQKAHADLCIAAAPLISDHPDVYLVVAGEGPERSKLEHLADETELGEHLKLIGMRDDVPRLLAAADLFVFPSRFEGFPLALLEAMAHGVPALATDFAGVSEIVRGTRDAVVVPVRDVSALRDALEWALENPEAMNMMSRSAQERAREFSADRMVDTTLALLARSARKR